MLSVSQLTALYNHACELDVLAFKPGNVSVYAEGHAMTATDFKISAQVSSEPLCNPLYSLGERIYYAVKATREAVACNTNLGIILLCAPLIQAAQNLQPGQRLPETLAKLLVTTTTLDAQWVFKAISLAAPGGLGSAPEQDVQNLPTVTLTEAMQLAGYKDRIAFQYTSGFKDIFDFAVFKYNHMLNRFGKMEWAMVAVYAGLLSRFPDSHIERKYGAQYTTMVTEQMVQLEKALLSTNNPECLMPLLFDMDKALKIKGLNPGTTADMSVATAFTVLLENALAKASL